MAPIESGALDAPLVDMQEADVAVGLALLEEAGWNQTQAAERLQITRRTLKLRMDRCGLKPRGE